MIAHCGTTGPKFNEIANLVTNHCYCTLRFTFKENLTTGSDGDLAGRGGHPACLFRLLCIEILSEMKCHESFVVLQE